MRPINPTDLSDGVRTLTDDLSASVTRSVTRAMSGAIKGIADDIRGGRFQDARDATRALDFAEPLSATEKTIRKFTRSAMLLGSGAVDRPTTSLLANGAPYPWESDVGAVRLIHRMAGHILSRDTRRRLDERITAASRFQKADPIDPAKLAKDINRYLRGEIKRVVDVSANVVGTRVAAYGMYYEARARGISRYRIDAIRDDNTTDICKNMDGREFSVEEAFTKTGTVLSTSDPTDLKKIAPFPDLDAIGNLSNAELQARGFDTPPFHFLCRSVVTLIDSQKEYDPVDWSNFPETARDIGQHQRAIQPKYDRMAERIWGATPDDLFNIALKSGPGDGIDDIYHVNAYTGNAFNQINEKLRRNRPWEDGSELPDIAKTMDDLIDKSSAPDVTYSYRGVRTDLADKMAVGKVFQDDGFVSTSLEPAVALDFAGSGTKTVMQIQIGAGQKALPGYAVSLTPAEAELILPRGSQFRIIGRALQKIDGEDVVVIRVVMQEAQGDVLPLSKIGTTDLPEADSVVKAEPGHEGKFAYERGDLREASMSG